MPGYQACLSAVDDFAERLSCVVVALVFGFPLAGVVRVR